MRDNNPRVEMRPPHALHPNPGNVRIHPKRQLRQLSKIMREVGFIGAIIVDENDMILSGHARCAAAIHNEMPLVPTIRVCGLDEARKRTFVLADNKLAEKSGFDRELLAVELRNLSELLAPLDLDLTLAGFDPAEVDALFADLGDDNSDPVDPPHTPAEESVTRRGDIWCLGKHRIGCRDARSEDDLDRLMAGRRAKMVFADPPYNVRMSTPLQ
jgi:hypothetical protein